MHVDLRIKLALYCLKGILSTNPLSGHEQTVNIKKPNIVCQPHVAFSSVPQNSIIGQKLYKRHKRVNFLNWLADVANEYDKHE